MSTSIWEPEKVGAGVICTNRFSKSGAGSWGAKIVPVEGRTGSWGKGVSRACALTIPVVESSGSVGERRGAAPGVAPARASARIPFLRLFRIRRGTHTL